MAEPLKVQFKFKLAARDVSLQLLNRREEARQSGSSRSGQLKNAEGKNGYRVRDGLPGERRLVDLCGPKNPEIRQDSKQVGDEGLEPPTFTV